ncbi:MAG: MotA/TolQ/ExbB proton channel family protein [Planctomycetota bacterium]
MSSTRARTLALPLLVLLAVSTLAWAADAKSLPREKTLWDLLLAGGFVGWLIMGLSVAGLALIIEHVLSIRRETLCPPGLVKDLKNLLQEDNVEGALALCKGDKGFLAAVMGAALEKASGGPEEMKAAMAEVGEEEAFKLNMKISYLSLIGNVAPMLGLLGTVTGMIKSFGIIERESNPTPALLAKGVYEALVTTAQGLFVAIPILAVYFFYKNRVTKLVIEIGIVAGALMERFKAPPNPQAGGTRRK